MKVLHFSSAKTWRGGEQQIAYLLVELRKSGLEQIVFCVKNSEIEQYCKKEHFEFETYKKRASIDPGPGAKLSRFVSKNKIDLIHIHDAHVHTFACMSATLFGLKTPFILSRRVDFPIRKSFLSQWKYNHKNIKAILCVSDFIKTIIEPDIKDPSIIKVVHSGIDLSKFRYKKNTILKEAFDIPFQHVLIANVAAIAPHKDYFTFVDTAELILKTRKDVHFLIIGGDGGEEESVRKYIQQKELSKQIQLSGFRTDIPEILPGIDLFLFTSKTEGLGTSLLDALACKIPVVATNAGGAPEVIEHQKTGLVAKIKDADQLSKHVLTLLDDPILQERFVNNGLKKLQAFTTTATAQKTLEAYSLVFSQIKGN